MKPSQVRSTVLVVLVLSSLLTVSMLVSAPKPQGSLMIKSEPEGAWRQHPTLPLNLYAQAAEALREEDLQKARQELERVASRHPGQAAQARVVAGLYAHEAGEPALAKDLLSAASVPGGSLEDWRLYLLAESAAESGDFDLAKSTYARLIADCPDSSLRPLAFLEAATLAAKHDQPRLALDLVAEARKSGVDGEVGEDLDSLAWRIGRELEDEGVQREAGLRLLVDDPLSADARQAVRTFRALDGGELDWNRLLSPQDVLRRAQSFLEAESLPTAALITLEEIPEGQRDFEWHLLKARALTQSGHGRDALTVLGKLLPSAAEERAALEWERVLAMAEAGDRQAASVYIARLARTHARLQLSETSLRRLYEDFLDAGLFDPAVDTLRLLRRLDPLDDTGAADLWERGWREYRNGNSTSAISYWTVLAEIYPGDGDAQRGTYWKARALEELGEPGRAREIYRDLVASSDTNDFYSRQALTRLGETPVRDGMVLAQAPAGAWPEEPALKRVKLLTDLGLDDLASRELGMLAHQVNPRDVLALKGLILSRKGDQRAGIVLLREAFPSLGGPAQSTVPAEVLFAYYPLEYADSILIHARDAGVPPNLVAGIIRQESAFDPRATSPVGARGLMQLMPATAREVSGKVGVPYRPDELYNPDLSVRLGSTYFRELLDRFDGNVELALAGYNGGPNRIKRLWKESGPEAELDDFLETLDLDESRNYVKRILVLADSYRQLYPSLG